MCPLLSLTGMGPSLTTTDPGPELEPEQARLLFRAFADPVRLAVVEALAGGERCVCELTAELGLAQSRLSFHLRVLRDAGLLESREQGRWVYYRLSPEVIHGLQHWLAVLAQRCQRPAQPCAG
jgi:ArsR family transcriptional regulator, arsenate/arsenite/antimonite-responsive transcriptional repressor